MLRLCLHSANILQAFLGLFSSDGGIGFVDVATLEVSTCLDSSDGGCSCA